jgi:transcriptional regulator with XRE-family HTH domain
MSVLDPSAVSFGDHLRAWRRRRRMSQLDLALEAEVSQRHVSFVESGKAAPSRAMVLALADGLDVPLRERNALLLAAGFAPGYARRDLDHPDLAAAMAAVTRVLKAHEPFPALAVDGGWRLVAANAAVAPLLDLVRDRALLAAPVNVLRLSLHPQGLAPAIVNLVEWRRHLLHRLRRQIHAACDPRLSALLQELESYPVRAAPRADGGDLAGIAVPLRLATPLGELSFLSTTTVFGTPADVTLAEIAIEAFLPADAATARALGVAEKEP